MTLVWQSLCVAHRRGGGEPTTGGGELEGLDLAVLGPAALVEAFLEWHLMHLAMTTLVQGVPAQGAMRARF